MVSEYLICKSLMLTAGKRHTRVPESVSGLKMGDWVDGSAFRSACSPSGLGGACLLTLAL